MASTNLRGRYLSLAQIAFVVAPSFILFGYNQAGIGGLLSLPSWTSTFPALDTTNTTGALKSKNATNQGIIISTFVMGALIGCLGSLYSGDILGRRKIIFFGGLFTLIGQALCSSSSSLIQFIIGRVCIGTAIGIFSSIVPVWQAECSSAAHRGKHVVLDGIFISMGYAIVSWTNFASSQTKSSNSAITWRLPLALPTIFSITIISSIFFMAESPRWLIQVGRYEDATEALSRIKDLPFDDPEMTSAIDDIRNKLDESNTKKASLKDMFTMGPDKLFYRFCLCIGLQFYQQMSGANLISVYAPVIFEQNLGLHGRMARILSGGTLTWKFLSSFVAFFTIDRFGRRPLFMISGVGMGSCMLILGITTRYDKDNLIASYISVVAIFVYNFFVPIGFLGANFLYCAEIAPVSLRVGMAAISTANHWVWNFVVIMSSPVAIASIGHWYFFLFAIIGLSIPATVWMLFPETMGRTLEEIEDSFQQSETVRAVVKASQTSRRRVRKGGDEIDDINKKAENSLKRELSRSVSL
ncbi:Sugar transporter STL1 [Golovinomyces cichoracearum]|uniref:Sugar transporter STL1 n=1 Tax=Golovinomyces cichoracearum TaxID=62708 RepID=A0A420IVY3_9PEZI|nr:Sugar transporter STL1 [Golovinomyces cichoracearum]